MKGWANYGQKLLEHSHTHLFTYWLQILSPSQGKAEYLKQRPYAQQNTMFTVKFFMEKV